MKGQEIIFKEVLENIGFIPNSIKTIAIRPNILGAFSMLFTNIKSFSSSKITTWTGLKLVLKNLRWTLSARCDSHLEVPAYLKDLIANVASNAAGCRYCEAHTEYAAHKNGVSIEKIKQIWEFQTSHLFSEKERAALSFAMAATVPNQVTTEHHSKLKVFFSKSQILEIVATISIFQFLNRWNDSMATELEDVPLKFANKYLPYNWEDGKHQMK